MKTIYCCLLLLLTAGAAAQKSTDAPLNTQQLRISFNPIAFANPDQRLMLGVERLISTRLSAVLDASWIVHSEYIENIQRTTGFELRPAIRYYYEESGVGYLQGQLLYRHANYRMFDWLGKDCVAGVPSFEQLQQFNFRKQNLGGALVTGAVLKLGRNWLFDLSMGFGVVKRSQKVVGSEGCYNPPQRWLSQRDDPSLIVPVIPTAFKLVYVVR